MRKMDIHTAPRLWDMVTAQQRVLREGIDCYREQTGVRPSYVHVSARHPFAKCGAVSGLVVKVNDLVREGMMVVTEEEGNGRWLLG